MPRETRDHIEHCNELYGFLDQSVISSKNIVRLETLAKHKDRQVTELAALILEIARVLPGKRNRWLKLSQCHQSLFNRAVDLLGIEFFEDLLAGYGDFESPLWHILEQYRTTSSQRAPARD